MWASLELGRHLAPARVHLLAVTSDGGRAREPSEFAPDAPATGKAHSPHADGPKGDTERLAELPEATSCHALSYTRRPHARIIWASCTWSTGVAVPFDLADHDVAGWLWTAAMVTHGVGVGMRAHSVMK